VSDLFLREVGNVSGHRRCDDQAARSSLLEVRAHGLRTVVHAVQIRTNDLMPVLNAGVENTVVSGPSSVRNQNIHLAEVLDDVVDQLLHVLEVADVALVGLALDAVLLGDVLGVLLAARGTGGVCDGYVGAHFCTSSSSLGADAGCTGGTSHNDNFAFEAEKFMETVVGKWTAAGERGGEAENRWARGRRGRRTWWIWERG
jgi:hypothetical protein